MKGFRKGSEGVQEVQGFKGFKGFKGSRGPKKEAWRLAYLHRRLEHPLTVPSAYLEP